MSDKELIKMRELDDVAEKAGGFVSNYSSDNIKYNYREIVKYCKERCVEPQDMTIRELNSFIL